MIPTVNGAGKTSRQAHENIAYIRQMLGELRGVASNEGADMLCYLIEMAFVEAGDIQLGKRQLSIQQAQRNKTAGVTVKPPGEVQF